MAPIFRYFGLKVIALLHLYLQKKNSLGFGHGWFEYHLLRIISRFCHDILSVNKDNQHVFPGSVTFIGNFISPWFLNMSSQEIKRYDLGLIARLSPQKDVKLFVRLVKNLNDFMERPIFALIVGKGEDQEVVRQEINHLGLQKTIEMLPWINRHELPIVYDRIRCFAITSHHEGFATTLLEAHARGVPAITTRRSGYCAEFVEGLDQPTGLVFTPADVDSFSFLNKVAELIENSASSYEDCRVKAQKFSEERVLGAIRNSIEALAVRNDTKYY